MLGLFGGDLKGNLGGDRFIRTLYRDLIRIRLFLLFGGDSNRFFNGDLDGDLLRLFDWDSVCNLDGELGTRTLVEGVGWRLSWRLAETLGWGF